MSLPERRRCVTYLRGEYEISERRACQAMQMNRSSYRYVGINEFEDERYQRVVSLSQQYPYWGYRKIYDSWRAARQGAFQWYGSSARAYADFVLSRSGVDPVVALRQ